MNRDRELARLKPSADKALYFSGWDLSNVQPRLLDPRPAWDYEVLVREYAGKGRALDLGTGGEEFLSRVRSSLPQTTLATEELRVNAPIAKRRLTPLDVDTIRCKSTKLPLPTSTFDLLLDRHENSTRLKLHECSHPVATLLPAGG